MKRALLAVLAVLCLVLNACSQRSLLDKLEPKAESSTAKAIIDQLRDGNLDAVKSQLDPKYAGPDVDNTLTELAALFPKGAPDSVKTVGAYTAYAGKAGSPLQRTEFRLTYEYQFRDKWILASVVLVRQHDKLLIEGLHARPMAESLEASNAFTFKNKGIVHGTMLALCAADVLLSLYAFVLCLRTPIRRRKWLWALFTLLGVTTLRFDWSSGQFAFQALSVQLFSGSAMAQPYGPWVLGLSIPLGAIWFLAVRRQLIAASAPPALPTAGTAP